MRSTLMMIGLWTGCKGTSLTDAPSEPGLMEPLGPPDSTAPTSLPPEQEGDLFLLPPAQTDAYVFVANALRDTVTRVEVATLTVVTAPTGRSPSLVRTTPDQRLAVVFGSGDDTLTLLETDTLAARTVEVRPHLNALELTPDGAYAILWRDLRTEEAEEDTLEDSESPGRDGLQAFNEVSFVRLSDGAHFPMALGFEPRMVRFTPDGKLAVVVTQGNLAAIDLSSPQLVPRLFDLARGSLQPPLAEEVLVAPSGSFAWVRPFGAEALLVVDLATGEIEEVPCGTNPTDLDLSPDGKRAVAVARGSAELWSYDAQSPSAPPEIVALPQDAGYGSLLFAPSGLGVLYTTATPLERFALWDPVQGSLVERSLVKPVSSMAVTPTGETLLVFHTQQDGPQTEPLFSGQHALTLADLSDLRSNPLLLPAKPLGYANSTTGDRGYFVMEGEPFLEVLDYTTLLHEQYRLASQPEYVGVLPDLAPEDGDEPPAWVSQEHELGRLSFFDADDGSLETLTGFELNAGVE